MCRPSFNNEDCFVLIIIRACNGINGTRQDRIIAVEIRNGAGQDSLLKMLSGHGINLGCQPIGK